MRHLRLQLYDAVHERHSCSDGLFKTLKFLRKILHGSVYDLNVHFDDNQCEKKKLCSSFISGASSSPWICTFEAVVPTAQLDLPSVPKLLGFCCMNMICELRGLISSIVFFIQFIGKSSSSECMTCA